MVIGEGHHRCGGGDGPRPLAWSGKRPGNPGTTEVRVRKGAFDSELALAPGRWEVAVETVPTDVLARTRIRRRIRLIGEGFVAILAAKQGGKAWVQVTADGVEVESGATLRSGERLVVQARQAVVFRRAASADPWWACRATHRPS
ncbi:MAG: hypothetical protein U0667_03355 [Chloroflexota bacterium]